MGLSAVLASIFLAIGGTAAAVPSTTRAPTTTNTAAGPTATIGAGRSNLTIPVPEVQVYGQEDCKGGSITTYGYIDVWDVDIFGSFKSFKIVSPGQCNVLSIDRNALWSTADLKTMPLLTCISHTDRLPNGKIADWELREGPFRGFWKFFGQDVSGPRVIWTDCGGEEPKTSLPSSTATTITTTLQMGASSRPTPTTTSSPPSSVQEIYGPTPNF